MCMCLGVPWWLSGKESACNAGDTGWIPGSGRFPRGGRGNPLQCSGGLQSMGSQRAGHDWSGWAHTHKYVFIMYWKLVAHLCQTSFCDSMDYSPPGSSVLEFSRQVYWSGLSFPSLEEISDPRIKPGSPVLQADSLPTELIGKPFIMYYKLFKKKTTKGQGLNLPLLFFWLE